jgi:hypothetical protein
VAVNPIGFFAKYDDSAFFATESTLKGLFLTDRVFQEKGLVRHLRVPPAI